MNVMVDAQTIVPGTRRQLSKEKTRKKVFETARHFFIEKSYAEATIRDIAAAVEMSTGAVFASFTNKEELLAAILEQEHLDYEERLNVILRRDKTQQESLVELLAVDYEPDRLKLFRKEAALSWGGELKHGNLLQKRFLALDELVQKHFCEGPFGTELLTLVWAHHQANCCPTADTDEKPDSNAMKNRLAEQVQVLIVGLTNLTD